MPQGRTNPPSRLPDNPKNVLLSPGGGEGANKDSHRSDSQPPFRKGGEGGFLSSDGLTEQHWGEKRQRMGVPEGGHWVGRRLRKEPWVEARGSPGIEPR